MSPVQFELEEGCQISEVPKHPQEASELEPQTIDLLSNKSPSTRYKVHIRHAPIGGDFTLYQYTGSGGMPWIVIFANKPLGNNEKHKISGVGVISGYSIV